MRSVVGAWVCPFVKLHLTSAASFLPENVLSHTQMAAEYKSPLFLMQVSLYSISMSMSISESSPLQKNHEHAPGCNGGLFMQSWFPISTVCVL